MADSPPSPYDAFVKRMLSNPADAASELKSVLSPEISTLPDWDELKLMPGTFVSQMLSSRFTDLLFQTRIKGREAFIYTLIEHQSSPHRLMPFRILEYMVAIWNRYLQDHPSAKRLPAIIPLVLYASPYGRRWCYPTELADLIDLEPTDRAAFGDHLPRLRFILDDLTAVDLPALTARPLTPGARVVLTLLKAAANNARLRELVLPLVGDLRALRARPGGEDDWECVVAFILVVGDTDGADLTDVVDKIGPGAKEAMMTTLERIRAEERVKTEIATLAKALVKQLSARFGLLPAWVLDRVGQADADQLDAWMVRFANANTLEEVFGD